MIVLWLEVLLPRHLCHFSFPCHFEGLFDSSLMAFSLFLYHNKAAFYSET